MKRGQLTILGGLVELAETMEEAVRRQVKEEVELDVYVVTLLPTQEVIFTPKL